MTQELKPITRGALDLRKLLEEHGSVAKQDVRDWLAEHDPELTPSTINFVVGYGQGAHRDWWHEDAEGFLVKGPKPAKTAEESPSEVPVGLSDEVKKPALLDPSAMSEPRDQFYTIALNLGIPVKAASITAFSCWSTAEMFNPEEAWQAIVQSSALVPSQKRSLWRNWCAWAGIKIPAALAETVEKQYSALSSTAGSKGSGVAPAPSRRFIAVKGDVVMVEPDDPGGMAFSEALRTAEQQARIPATGQHDSGVMVAALHESGENLRTFLQASNKGDSGAQTTLLMAQMENARRENDLRQERIESDRRKDAELARTTEEHRWELAREREETRWQQAQDREDRRQENLTKALAELSANRKGPFDGIEELAPGFIQRMVDNVLNPPHQEGAFKVTIGDQEGNMTLDQYERFSKVENQKEFTKMLRLQVPEFFAMGRDFAQATKRAAQGDHEELPVSPKPVSQPDPGFNGYCIACIRMLMLPENVEQFTCPHCGALQNMAGELLSAAPVEQEELRAEQLPPPEELADNVFDADALVIRPLDPLDKDREWSPEPVREGEPPPSRSEVANQPAETVASA
jgi:hypothetical protein